MIRVKICGLTRLEDAWCAVEAGADFLGFICYPRSPRYLTPRDIRRIVAEVRARGAQTPAIGVFVNASLMEVRQVMEAAGLDLVQLHGDEPPDWVAALGGRAFKAIRPPTLSEGITAWERYRPVTSTALEHPRLLVDAYHPDAYGGTGAIGDWTMAAELARRCDRLLLAGGLHPDNVAAAVAMVHPWGVDVSSGVESAPGRKDHGKIRAFIAAVREPGQAADKRGGVH
ncbi:MAG: phosphoribosylanthranilate isomerase [Anaerolineae bacterium]